MNTSLLPKTSKLSVAILPMAILLALIASIYLIFFSNENNKNITQAHITNSDKINTSIVNIDKPKNTIATAWKWGDSANTLEEEEAPTSLSSSLFSAEAVYTTLQRVKLDDDNNVIIDHQALIALNETLNKTFNGRPLQLDEQALHELQIIIRQGLPGNAGDEVAKIVTDYYHYLAASKEFNAIYEADHSTAQAIENTIEDHETNYRELIALRELYLGNDTSSKLFSTSDANAAYMFDMLKIEQSSNLSVEEKQQQSAEIMERHSEQTINISNWSERYGVFQGARQNILSASIDEEEKQMQLTELMHQHFNSEELANISHLQLDKP